MPDDAFDGLCAIFSPFMLRDGMRWRCSFEMGHGGDHSWEKYRRQFQISAGVFRSDMIRWLYPQPKGCTCQPLRSDKGEIVEYVFSADCPVHEKPRP